MDRPTPRLLPSRLTRLYLKGRRRRAPSLWRKGNESLPPVAPEEVFCRSRWQLIHISLASKTEHFMSFRRRHAAIVFCLHLRGRLGGEVNEFCAGREIRLIPGRSVLRGTSVACSRKPSWESALGKNDGGTQNL